MVNFEGGEKVAPVKPGYQELRGNDIYSWVKVAARFAKHGGLKGVRFWLFDWIQLHGVIQIPPNTKEGDVIRVPRNQIHDQFYIAAMYAGWMPGDTSIKPTPNGDVCFVIEFKRP